ncbi:MAG TPA: FtsX-like permease family protein, partial [Ohtaekwangia sp.]|uniref:ABC transporter permease n=1 Tax=Ohtaekwangia sp. TaxID=2066019 RepID=UPI002F937545
MSSFQPVKILKSQLSNATGPQRLRKSLLVIQLSISIGIIIFSGVLYLQLQYITQKNLGFDRENMIRVEPTANIFRKFDAFKNELSKHASIISVATSANNPLDIGGGNTGVSWPGKPKDLRVTFKTIACSYEFPETLGLKLIDGRGFFSQPQDSLHTEVLITEEASKVMGLQKPVGTIINIGESACVITGVVNDFHTNSLHEARMPAILFRVRYWNTSAVYIKYQPGTAQQSLAAIGTAYKQLEPDYTMKYWFQDDTFNELYKTEITASKLVLIFTIVALVIACIGIASLATFNALRKTKEIGIRRVFGATIFQMLVLLFNEFAIVLLVAILASAPLAWYAADEWLTGFAYHTTMPWWVFGSTFAGVALLIILITWLQGMRAAASSPAKTLRTE